MKPRDRAQALKYSLDWPHLDVADIATAIEEAENAAVAAALADVVRLLRHCGKPDTAARLVHALETDRQQVRKGQTTAFPALRAAVPLPS